MTAQKPRLRIAMYSTAMISLVTATGCLPASGTAFRDNALPAIENGVELILDGLVDGLFAAIDTEPSTEENAG